MRTKICISCGKEFPETREYFQYRVDLDRYRNQCRECIRRFKRELYAENKDKINKKRREKYYPEYYRQYNKDYRKNNKESLNKKIAKRALEKYHNDEQYRVKENINRKMRADLKNKEKKKSISTERDIGCTLNKLRLHLELQFQDGMTWDNYYRKGWTTDHIIPISLYDITNISERKKAFNYRNIRPLWFMDNILKKNKLDIDLIKQYGIEDLLPKGIEIYG